jgi:hypothetical protein
MRTNKCKTNKEIDQKIQIIWISDQTDVSCNLNYFVFFLIIYLSSYSEGPSALATEAPQPLRLIVRTLNF